MIYIWLCIAFTVIGQLLLKVGMTELGSPPVPLSVWSGLKYFLVALLNWKVSGALMLAMLAAFAWMAAMSRIDLSVGYPFMGLAIVLVIALAPMVLGEAPSVQRWVGVGLVVAGIWVASR